MLRPRARFALLLLAVAAPSVAGAAAAFDLDTVAEKAHALAVDA